MKNWKALLICVCCVCLTPCLAVTSLADAIIDWYQNDRWSADYDIEVTDPDGYVNIRSGPGTNYDILTTAPTGTILHVSAEGLASDGATWCQITYNGYTGWLALSRATVSESTPTPAPTAAPTATPEPTAAPEVTAAPEASPTEAPAAAEDDTDTAKPDDQKDTLQKTDAAEADPARESAAPNTALLLVIFILLVLLVIAIAVLLIVLLRRRR